MKNVWFCVHRLRSVLIARCCWCFEKRPLWLVVAVGMLVVLPGPGVSKLEAAQSAAEPLQEQQLWQLLASAEDSDQPLVVLIRHALAPGTGDPSTVVIGDCSTQRNLSEEGREQARAIGSLFEQQGVAQVSIYSSEWCRCMETAKLMGLGSVQELPSLNSFFGQPSRRQKQTDETLLWLQGRLNASSLAVLVTHQVNITALTGVYPASGEMVVVQLDELEKTGTTQLVSEPRIELRVLGSIATR